MPALPIVATYDTVGHGRDCGVAGARRIRVAMAADLRCAEEKTMDATSPQVPPHDPPASSRAMKPTISPARRRAGAIAAVVVAAALGMILWQTWGWWREYGPHPGTPVVGGDVGPGSFGRPGGGFPSPTEMRRRFQDQIKATLDVTEEEWARLQPKIEAVTRLQDQLRPAGGPGMPVGPAMPGAGRPPGPPFDASDASDFARKREMLQSAIEDEQTTPQALAANLAAARAARSRLQAELKTAQDELRNSLAPRQEAALVTLGVLD
jgi:hypothetical protein